MEEQDIRNIVAKELLDFDEKYVQEKVYWQRTVRMIVVVSSMLLSLFGGLIAWGFNVSNSVTNNTQGRRDLERRMDVIERQHTAMMDNYNVVVKNQAEVIAASNKLCRKLDLIMDKVGARGE